MNYDICAQGKDPESHLIHFWLDIIPFIQDDSKLVIRKALNQEHSLCRM